MVWDDKTAGSLYPFCKICRYISCNLGWKAGKEAVFWYLGLTAGKKGSIWFGAGGLYLL